MEKFIAKTEINKRVDNIAPEISVLHQISRALVHRNNVSQLLADILAILEKEMDLLRGTVTLRQGDLLVIEASHGLSKEEILRGVYRIGEGVTGTVAAHAKARIIPDISESLEFLNRTRTRAAEKNIAFLCVPIIYQESVIGTLSIDKKTSPDSNLRKDLSLLETVANIMADAMSILFLQKKERERLLEENKILRIELSEKNVSGGIIGKCNDMRQVISKISRFAESDAPILVRGEPGTGKKLIANAILEKSKRKDKPFNTLNCLALSDVALNTELFGAKKGALDSDSPTKVGILEASNGGTVFIDKIENLSEDAQLKLLRFMQDRSFYKLGSSKQIKSDVRIIAISSQNLEELVVQKKFNAELLGRLNTLSITLPPLRYRRSDITLLAEHFIANFNLKHKKKIKRISRPALNMFMSYFWPANVRELENCIESAGLLTTDAVIYSYNLPPSLQTSLSTNTAKLHPDSEIDFIENVRSYERELICEALKIHKGNASAAARHLSLSQRIMNYKIKNLNIDASSFKKVTNRRRKIKV